MSKYLPERIFPLRLAREEHRLRGSISTQPMLRLKRELAFSPTKVDVDLFFRMSKDCQHLAKGVVWATCSFICQRCLDQLLLKVEAKIQVNLVSEGEAHEPRDFCEFIAIGDSGISLSTWMEDELLLAIPQVPVHNYDCTTEDIRRALSGQSGQVAENRPFAGLSSLAKHN